MPIAAGSLQAAHGFTFLSSASGQGAGEHLLLFMITGNPGLIEYYDTFLTLVFDALRDSLSTTSGSKIDLHVSGVSLAGFGYDECSQTEATRPFGLQDQIEHVERHVQLAVENVQRAGGTSSNVRVILMGHSVGSYMLLEILRRQKDHDVPEMRTIGGLCLFPTVTEIAKSPSGRKITYLLAIPQFPLIASWIVKTLTFWLPFGVLQCLVSLVTGMPSDAARTTTSFIKSKMGVRQALYMAKDEMAMITADKWDDELWGVSTVRSRQKTKLFFLFGTGDHWVADQTRDELIAARAFEGRLDPDERHVMEIDRTGIPHGFCIKHNEPVARKVEDYIRDIVRSNW